MALIDCIFFTYAWRDLVWLDHGPRHTQHTAVQSYSVHTVTSVTQPLAGHGRCQHLLPPTITTSFTKVKEQIFVCTDNFHNVYSYKKDR